MDGGNVTMIFGNRKFTQSPTKDQMFIWVADYADGSHYSEYDFQTLKSNSFYSIERNKVIRFGLIGSSSQVYFDVGNGVFTINNHRFTFSYAAEDNEYPLTGRALIYNDLITYKDAVSDASVFLKNRKQGIFGNTITQFNVGYKKKMDLSDTTINFQCVLSAPLNDSSFFQLKISSTKDLIGKLIIRRNGNIVDQIYAPLKENAAGQINWTLK